MRARLFFALLLSLLPLCAPAMAQPGPGGVQPLDRLLPGIRRAHPGNFYDAEGPTYGPQGDPHYHLKWMTPDGRVVWYDTDARNGRVLRTSPGRDNFDGGPPGYGRGFGGPVAGGPPGMGPGGPGGGPYPYARRFSPGGGYGRPFGGPGGGFGGPGRGFGGRGFGGGREGGGRWRH